MADRSSHSSTGSSGYFSATTKAHTLQIAGNTCWACSTRSPEICHVVPHHDSQIPVWEQAGLFTFNYKTVSNAIPMCASCHTEFDMSLDPGYVFFPTDIQYFIGFERRDHARREKLAADTGTPISSLPRQVPTSADYKQHEMDLNLISPDSIGGRYNRVFLKQFLHNGEIPGIEARYATPKAWHGAPLASIRRVFAVLSSPRFFMIVDSNTRNLLGELLELYFRDDRISSEQVLLRDIYRPQVLTGEKHQLQEQSSDESERRGKKSKTQDTAFTGPHVTGNQCHEHTEWVLGPQSTTNDVVRLFAPIFSSP